MAFTDGMEVIDEPAPATASEFPIIKFGAITYEVKHQCGVWFRRVPGDDAWIACDGALAKMVQEKVEGTADA
jgi:hypothetical protein